MKVNNLSFPFQIRSFFINYLAVNAYCYYGSYCEQLCFQINNDNTPKCDCAIGYKLNNDGRTCSPKSQQYIIYSTHSLLRAFDHRSNDSAREDVMPLIGGKINCKNFEMIFEKNTFRK